MTEALITIAKDVFVPIICAFLAAHAVIRSKLIEIKKKQEPEKDLNSDEAIDEIDTIVDAIGERLDCRCDLHLGHNGVKGISGFSFKKLSMISEYTGKYSSNMYQSQDVPTVVYKRNMKALRASPEGYIVSYEDQHKDVLATIIKGFGVNTFYAFKVLDLHERWTAIVTLGFKDKKHDLPETDIAWVQFQVSRIGALLSDYKH